MEKYSKEKQYWLIISGILGFLGVALGAFGAHALENTLTPRMLETYRTGIMYHLIHAAVITAISLLGNEKLYRAALFFTIGIGLFSFSLYLYTTTSVRWLAMVTPFGGVSFLIGWGMLIIEGLKLNKAG